MMDASVKLLLSEIKYEVKFDSWLKNRVTNAEQRNANKKAYKSVEYAFKDDKAEDWLVRQIQDAVDSVYGRLRWCLHDDSRMQSDEIWKNPTEWSLHFRFSEMWRGSVRSLKAHIHRYVCDYVISQWYRAMNDERAQQNYTISAENHLEKAYNEARSEVVWIEPWRL